MNQTVNVRFAEVYGITKVYPVCNSAQLFAQIAGTITLTNTTIRLIKELGYKVVSQQPLQTKTLTQEVEL